MFDVSVTYTNETRQNLPIIGRRARRLSATTVRIGGERSACWPCRASTALSMDRLSILAPLSPPSRRELFKINPKEVIYAAIHSAFLKYHRKGIPHKTIRNFA